MKDQWQGCLINCLTGRALTAYRLVVQGGECDNYEDMKDRLLEAMGLGLEQTTRKFRTPNKNIIQMID